MDTIDKLIEHARAAGQKVLSEYDSKRVLAAASINVCKEVLAADATDAAAAAANLGYPVAVKACSHNLLHKTDRGLVYLGVPDQPALDRAISEIEVALGGANIDGYLVQKMVDGRREIIIGGIRDDSFGPCVMLGLGGILVEAVGDVSFRLAPLEERDALEMIGELRGRAVFEPFRGEPAVDKSALSSALIAVGDVLVAHPRISQIDINPLIISANMPVAVDALVTLADEQE